MKAKDKLKKWMEKNIPAEKTYTSLLFKCKVDIEELYVQGYTQNQILKYLNEAHNIQTTQQNLSLFISRHINEADTKDIKTNNDESKKESKFDELDKKFSHLL